MFWICYPDQDNQDSKCPTDSNDSAVKSLETALREMETEDIEELGPDQMTVTVNIGGTVNNVVAAIQMLTVEEIQAAKALRSKK